MDALPFPTRVRATSQAEEDDQDPVLIDKNHNVRKGKAHDAGGLFVQEEDDEDEVVIVKDRPVKKRKTLNTYSILVEEGRS